MSLQKAWLVATLQLSLLVHRGRAVNCTLPSWDWTTNSLGQSPCTVAEKLEGSPDCRNELYVLSPLTAGENYPTPQNGSDPPCECNTVMYSLYQACTGCQDASIETWAFYEQFCAQVYVSQYPANLPQGITVPRWAYLNVTSGSGSFNATAASLAKDQPDITPTSPPTAVVPGGSSSALRTSTVNPESGTQSPSPSPSPIAPKALNTSTIAGGTVGGVVGLALIGGAIFYLLYRRRVKHFDEPPSKDSPFGGNMPIMSMTSQPLRQYDPSDPSTFPPPLGSSQTGDHVINDNSEGKNYPYHTAQLPRAKANYQGFPEV